MAMTDFIYCGETNVYQDDLESFLALAADLQLKGLEEGLKEIPKTDPIKDSEVESPTPLKTMKPMQKAKPRKVNVTEPANDHKSKELALSEQQNFGTDLDDLDAKVRSVMTTSENMEGRKDWQSANMHNLWQRRSCFEHNEPHRNGPHVWPLHSM